MHIDRKNLVEEELSQLNYSHDYFPKMLKDKNCVIDSINSIIPNEKTIFQNIIKILGIKKKDYSYRCKYK